MNSPLEYELAMARSAELRAMASPRVRRPAPPVRPRERAGWWLITVGLRLATGPVAGTR